jgi:hypothetical protein
MDLSRIPNKLNGFYIMGALARVMPNDQLHDSEVIILGHDPSRRNGKYVVATLEAADRRPYPPHPSIREWYWGHYYEELDPAMRQFMRRTNMGLALCEHKVERDMHCDDANCPNYYNAVNI